MENLPKWEWEQDPDLECTLIKTRQGTGKADGLVFHEVEEYTEKKKYSLLGNTILDRIFQEAGERRVLIEYKGMATGKNKRQYKNFEWSLWED